MSDSDYEQDSNAVAVAELRKYNYNSAFVTADS